MKHTEVKIKKFKIAQTIRLLILYPVISVQTPEGMMDKSVL